jgi:activator of HSP90 ATPase
MAIEFVLSTLISATPHEVYTAWLSSDGHTAMTGSPARINDRVGSHFEAWDGYIQGENLELEPGKRIIQSWRTSEFSDDEPDSHLEITLEPANGQTRLTLKHSELPKHGWQYKQGWVDSYFEPMQAYFQGRRVI